MSEHTHSAQCKHLLGNLSDYIDGELDEELCQEINRHVKECNNCRIVVDTIRKTIELYEQNSPPSDLPKDVRERLFMKLNLDEFTQKE